MFVPRAPAGSGLSSPICRFISGLVCASCGCLDVVQHSPQVAAVTSGHAHRSIAGSVGSIAVAVMPSIAMTLRKGEYPRSPEGLSDHIHRFDPASGFTVEARIVDVDRSGHRAR